MNIAEQFMSLDETTRSGSLRFFGVWFGRPLDNYHTSIDASLEGNLLKISFDQGEMLEVWNPSEIVVTEKMLKIPHATKVKWTWHSYGEPKSPENKMYYEYTVAGEEVQMETSSPYPENPSTKEAAVELYR